MRTHQKYRFREGLAIILQYLISRVSMWYFRNVSKARITLIRKQGIGDCIFATGPFEAFKKAHPDTRVNLVASFPQVFGQEASSGFSWRDFPLVWMMYEHYDFPQLKGSDQHIHKIIADHLNLPKGPEYCAEIVLSESETDPVYQEYIEDRQYLVIQPWAGGWNTSRNWDKESWTALVTALVNEGESVYQIGASSDEVIPGTVNLCGKTSLSESLMIIRHAKLFIGVNSFGEQAAGAFGIPSVILYGATNPVYSLNESQVAVFAEEALAYDQALAFDFQFPDLTEISVDHVRGQVVRLLNPRSIT